MGLTCYRCRWGHPRPLSPGEDKILRLKHRTGALGVALAGLVVVSWLVGAADKPEPKSRDELLKTYKDGNYRDAYDGLRKLVLDRRHDPGKVSDDCNTCLRQPGRVDEIDEFREGAVKAHEKNWRLLQTAALSLTSGDRHGYIVAGKFYRGNKRGGGRYVNTLQRDRVRALQLMQQALELTRGETAKSELADFHLNFANILLAGVGYHEPWRLQYVTDLAQLPDYEDGYGYYYHGSGRGAPVDEKGNPILHLVPKSYKEAASDGERWRWMLAQAVEFDPNRASSVDMIFAGFLYGEFGPQTMQHWGFRPRGSDE